MSTCYKNFPVVIDYPNSTTETIYANSLTLSESVAIENLAAIGAKGATTSYTKEVPQGSLSIESYLSSGSLQSLDLIRDNAQNLTIRAGRYIIPSPCVLSSMSISVNVGEPLILNRDYQYYGCVTTGEVSAISPDPIKPVVPEGISISGYTGIGGSNIVTNISWSVNQNYEQFNLLGNVTPVVVYAGAEKTMDIDGEGFTQALMESPTAGCVVPAKPYEITISGCGTGIGVLGITGYMTSRSSSVAAGEIESNGISIIQYL